MTPVFDSLAQVVVLAAAGIVLWRGDPALNRMNRATPWAIRHAFWLLVVASLGEFGGVICAGYVPGVVEVLVFCGVALLLICERRLRVLLPPARCLRKKEVA